MGFLAGKNVEFRVSLTPFTNINDGYRVAGLNTFSNPNEKETHDVTAFKDNYRKFIKTLSSGNLSLSGSYDPLDEGTKILKADHDYFYVLYAVDGTEATAEVAQFFTSNFTIDADVGAGVTFSAELMMYSDGWTPLNEQ